MAAQLTIFIGIPASGKSTLARQMAAVEPNTVHVSTDALRQEILGHIRNKTRDGFIFAEARRRTREWLQQGVNVIYDATNVTRQARRPFLHIARGLEVPVRAVWIRCPKEVALQRNRLREVPVPDHAIDEMDRDLQEPTPMEGFSAILTVEVEETQTEVAS